MCVDTSSAPAAGNDVVEFAAAAFAALIADPVAAKPSAAVAKSQVSPRQKTQVPPGEANKGQAVVGAPRRKSAALRLLCGPYPRAAFHGPETVDVKLLTRQPDLRHVRMREMSTLVNSVRNNGPEPLELGDPQPQQARLL